MKRREFMVAATGLVTVPILGHAQVKPCPPPSVQAVGGTTIVNMCVDQPAGATPAWLQGKAINEWVPLQAPGASSAMPSPALPGNSGVSSVTDAWGGGALRARGSYFILHGGGHQDYAGNEIYAMKLSDDAPKWQRIWGPTPLASIVSGLLDYSDGNPAAMHTYYFLTYDNVSDRLMRFAKAYYIQPTGLTNGVDAWQWGAASWMPSGSIPNQPSSSGFYSGQGLAQDADGNAYITNALDRYIWNRAGNKWTKGPTTSNDLTNNAMAFDTVRNVVWSFGGNIPAGKAVRWDVKANTESVVTLTGSAAALVGDQCMGAAYDPVADRVFIYKGTGVLYAFNPAALAVSTVPTTGSTPPTTSGSAQAPWGKFRYVPELGGLVLQPLWSSATLFLRTH